MNFFEHQDHAHQLTRRLIWLFMLAVVCIVIAVNATLGLAWFIAFPMHGVPGLSIGLDHLPPYFFLTNTAVTLLFIGGGTLLEIWRLRDGGDVVAEMAGARLLKSASPDPDERRLLNIVEEMSIASGIAVPRVYVMDRENGINAFAAGYNPHEAVVAVTRGVLTRLSRDELQGVIGHEFSHILNGDMRLNLRLMGVLYGILLIATFGEKLMQVLRHSRASGGNSRGNSHGKNGGMPLLALFVAGLCLWIVGYIGVFFGRLIKSAVSRQREFLADASAIQFTRNPDGIGSALRKIGGLSKAHEPGLPIGSQINSANAEHLSHLFLGAARPGLMSGWLATHPPIEERVRRIYGRSMPLLDAPEAPVEYSHSEPALAPIPYNVTRFAAAQDSAVPDTNRSTPVIPEALRQAAHIPVIAQRLILSLLHEPGHEPSGLNAIDRQTWWPALKKMPPELHIPLINLVSPTLKQLDDTARTHFLDEVHRLIRADGRMTLNEFVLETILSRRLEPGAGRAVAPRYSSLMQLRPALATVLSLVAQVTATQNPASMTVSEQFEKGLRVLDMKGLELLARDAIRFEAVRQALGQLNELAPLQKPILIKALYAISGHPVQSHACTALLRAISTALDVPTPLDEDAVLQ